MSAFEVSGTHIDILVSAALQRSRYGDTLTWYHGETPGTQPGEALPSHADYLAAPDRAHRQVTPENAGTWAAALLAENRRSVNHRYEQDEIEVPHVFTWYEGQFSAVAVLKAISCYEYQSCEHPGWKASEARAFCVALTDRMIGQLPGYDSGPWEINDPDDAFTSKAVKVWHHAGA